MGFQITPLHDLKFGRMLNFVGLQEYWLGMARNQFSTADIRKFDVSGRWPEPCCLILRQSMSDLSTVISRNVLATQDVLPEKHVDKWSEGSYSRRDCEMTTCMYVSFNTQVRSVPEV